MKEYEKPVIYIIDIECDDVMIASNPGTLGWDDLDVGDIF